jgi:hypothetical protein
MMRTDELVTLLATGDVAVDRAIAQRRLAIAVAAGLAGAGALMFTLLGVNPGLGAYLLLPMHWVKVIFAVVLAGTTLLLVLRLSFPGRRLGWSPVLPLIPLLVVACLGVAALLAASPAQRPELLLGRTWAVCPLSIAMLSVPAFVLLLWAMRALAPTRLRLAGAAAGLFAGAAGATAYTLHCPELAAPFIATWYVLGVLVPSAVGALIGPRVLRW